MHDLVFLTNNFEWAASTIAELYFAPLRLCVEMNCRF